MPALEAFKINLPWAEPMVPPYRTFSLGQWSLERTPKMMLPSYWYPIQMAPNGYRLVRKRHGKREVWMSVTPMELQSHMHHIDAAIGDVVVAGLGMGLYLYNILWRPLVKSVTVLEKDKKVIELFKRITDWPKWPGAAKLTIINVDALQWKPEPGRSIDFFYADIWPKVGDEVAHMQMQTMQKNIQAASVGYWTQEFDFVTFLQQNELGVNNSGGTVENFDKFRKMVGLPLVGVAYEQYPRLAIAAVAFHIAATYQKKNPTLYQALLAQGLRLLGAFDSMNQFTIPETPEPQASA